MDLSSNAVVYFLSYDGMTDPLGQSQVIPYLSGLRKKGFDITIVSFEKKQNKRHVPIVKELLSSNSIKWIRLDYTKKPPLISTMYDIWKLERTVKQLIKNDKGKKVLLHCRSYITALVGLVYKKKGTANFIFDMRGFWADERLEGGIWSMKNPFQRLGYKYFKKKEIEFLLHADYTVSLTNKGKAVINELIVKGKNIPIEVIPCCVNTELFSKNFSNTNKLEINKSLQVEKNQFVLGYVGSIGTWYMLEEMVAFYKVLLESKQTAVFLFITKDDPKHIELEFDKQRVSKKGLRITSAERSEVPDYIELFDWSIFFIKPVFSKQASSPTKQGEIMSMGKPILCNTNIGDTDLIISKYNAGVLLKNFENHDYKLAVESMLSWNNDADAIRYGAIDYFDLEKGIDSYEKIYKSCLIK